MAPPPGEILRIPGLPPIQLPPGTRAFGPEGLRGQAPDAADPRSSSAGSPAGPPPNQTKKTPAPDPAKAAAERAEKLKKALAPRPTQTAMRRHMLDELFTRLAAAHDLTEAEGTAGAIEHIWLRSDSDTANLLMERALVAMNGKHFPLALTLLDKIVLLQPDWAEAWNKRATTRFLADDLDGAMADIGQVLKLEPRHFRALSGLGIILQKSGLDKRALEVFRKALEIYPQQPDIQKIVEKLSLEVEGRDI